MKIIFIDAEDGNELPQFERDLELGQTYDMPEGYDFISRYYDDVIEKVWVKKI